MKSIIKYYFFLFIIILSTAGMAQSEWDIQLSRSSIDCSSKQVCYQLELQSATDNSWTIGDQNYRFFFDGDLMEVMTVQSLLPSEYYGAVNIDQNITITGQGQEIASPLDDIDNNLGFLDFSIIQTDKSNPLGATILSNNAFVPIAEICLNIDESVFNSTNSPCLLYPMVMKNFCKKRGKARFCGLPQLQKHFSSWIYIH